MTGGLVWDSGLVETETGRTEESCRLFVRIGLEARAPLVTGIVSCGSVSATKRC